MEIKDLFTPKEKQPQELFPPTIQEQERTALIENATHPQNNDEDMLREQNEKLADLRRWQQDLSPKFVKLFEKFAGMKITDNGRMIPVPGIKPRMNINGAYHIVNFLEVIDVNVIMSNYSEEGSKMAIRHGVGYPLVQFIKDNYREFGINKNYGDLRYIITTALNTAEPTFNRALNAGERNHDSKIYKVVRTENEQPKKEKKGIF